MQPQRAAPPCLQQVAAGFEPTHVLTAREVLRFMSGGHSNREIAAALCVAEGTVNTFG
jgi:DNA-binding CsgD family transcriptional regulator